MTLKQHQPLRKLYFYFCLLQRQQMYILCAKIQQTIIIGYSLVTKGRKDATSQLESTGP